MFLWLRWGLPKFLLVQYIKKPVTIHITMTLLQTMLRVHGALQVFNQVKDLVVGKISSYIVIKKVPSTVRDNSNLNQIKQKKLEDIILSLSIFLLPIDLITVVSFNLCMEHKSSLIFWIGSMITSSKLWWFFSSSQSINSIFKSMVIKVSWSDESTGVCMKTRQHKSIKGLVISLFILIFF